MLLTTCWIPSALVILTVYGDLILSTDLPALKPNSWSGIAVDTATLVVRLVTHLQFHGHRITIGFFHLPAYSKGSATYSAGHEHGTLIALEWPSALWWLLLVDGSGTWKIFIKDFFEN